MDPSVRSTALSAANRVRAAWTNAAPGHIPDLGALLAADPDLPPSARVESIITDAEQRWDRALPATLEHYQRTLGSPADASEIRRALLMCELSRRDAEPIDSLRTELLARHPDLAADIESVTAMAALMRAAAAEFPLEPALAVGQSLGKYVLIGRLGAGSFGEVWQARDTELDRYVALKLLYAAEGDEAASVATRAGASARFISEARAAAALDHENIVSVHDAGRFDHPSRYYIDSQLVGDPAPSPTDPIHVVVGRSLEPGLGKGLAGHALAREAARIVEAVSRAVAAAHARGILHRDLKPANILITPSGRPMVADFGLSISGVPPRPTETTATVERAATVAFTTDSGARIVGTPAYMAPEQARGEPATPLTDVFALGTILRFLLTGAAPYSPSGQFSPDARADVIAQARDAAVVPLRSHRDVPVRLAAIADRAMAADPKHRYVSAEQLAADLRAWLSHRPTLADRPSRVRMLGLWYRRNAVPATIAAASLLIIALGTARFIQRLEGERDRAVAAEELANKRRTEAEEARDVAAAANRFMSEALVAAIPGQLGISRDPKISEILTAASRRADTLSDQPLVEANARAIIGGAYQGLSRPADARPHLERALAIRSARLPPEHIDVLQSRRMMAQLDHNTGRTKEALKAMVELAEIDARALGPDHRETLVVLNTLGTLHQLNGDLTAAEKCQRAVYESRLRTLGPDHIETLGARRDIAGIMVHQHHFDEAVTELRDIIDSLRRRNDLRDGFIIALTNQDLAVALREAGKVDEAAPLFREAIAGLTASAGPEHRILLNAEHNLGNLLLFNRNDPEGALPLLRHAADTSARVMSADHVMTIRYRKTLGRCLLTMGRRDEAFTVFSAAHESAHRTLGPDHADTRDLATWIERTATGR